MSRHSQVLQRPYDKASAMELMKKFPEMAYSTAHLSLFQEAVYLLYGREFAVTTDLSKRMQFSCQICNREMNSENAMAEHFRSGGHQKNLDKRHRISGEASYVPRASNYARDSIQYKLVNSNIAPVGLQMVEEYINRKGHTYYKCFLCGAHGKMDIMYHHIVNKKHTEKYIKSACVLENSIITSNEREEIRKKLLIKEGLNVDAIKTIRGNEFYPYKWEAEGITAKEYSMKIKKERRFQSDSSRSSCDSPYKRRSRSVTPKWRRYSRSPSSSRSKSRERSRSKHHSPRCRHKSKKERRRKHRSGNSSSEALSPKRIKRERAASESSSPRTSSTDINSDRVISGYRNRSPPIGNVKKELVSPQNNGSSSVNIKTEPRTPVHGDNRLLVNPSNIKKEREDAATQTKVDIEPIIKRLFNVCKGEEDLPLRTSEDVKAHIDLMEIISSTLRELTVTSLQDGSSRDPAKKNELLVQKEIREKVIGYVTKWYRPTWEREIAGKF